MLAAYTKTFLRIGYSSMLRRDITEYDVLELVHAGIGEHQCRVVLDYHRSRRDNLVSLAAEEVLVGFSYFLCS